MKPNEPPAWQSLSDIAAQVRQIKVAVAKLRMGIIIVAVLSGLVLLMTIIKFF